MADKKAEASGNGVPKWTWKVLIWISVAIVLVASINNKNVLKRLHGIRSQSIWLQDYRGRFIPEPIRVLENSPKQIRVLPLEYKGKSTWYLTKKYEVGDEMILRRIPGKKWNYEGYWIDNKGNYLIRLNVNKARTKGVGLVYLTKKGNRVRLDLAP